MHKGKVPPKICYYLYGAKLIALVKKDGEIRPIAVDQTSPSGFKNRCPLSYGRFVRFSSDGFCTPRGSEAIVHAVRAFVEQSQAGECHMLLRFDFKNAFNTNHQDEILRAAGRSLLDYSAFLWQCYRNPTLLLCGDNALSSECGVQQGDPLGPLPFCLAIRTSIANLVSPLNVR